MEAPRDLQHAGEQIITIAARAVIDARRGFTRGIEAAKNHGISDQRVYELCADAGLDPYAVRELLETPAKEGAA